MAHAFVVLAEYFNSRSGIVILIKIKEVVAQPEKAAGAPSMSRPSNPASPTDHPVQRSPYGHGQWDGVRKPQGVRLQH